MSKEKCPFKVGDSVVYQPSDKGYYSDPPEWRLESGKKYKIEKIEKDNYFIVEGYKHPGGGIYWTEFSAT
jgi:hypothetical protein